MGHNSKRVPLTTNYTHNISMSIIASSDDLLKVEASLVPMHLQYSGSANTSEYFTPSKTTEKQNDGSEVNTAYFRGCRLVAKEVDLKKSGTEGYIINKNEVLQRETNEEEGTELVKTVKNYTAVASFDKMTLYGHDSEIELSNQWSLIPEFLEINSIIHE